MKCVPVVALQLLFFLLSGNADQDLLREHFNDEDYAHELVSLRHVQLRSAEGDDHHLHIDAFGENYRLRLKRADIFSPSFKVFSASLTPDGHTLLAQHNFDEREVGDIYSVQGGPGSISFRADDLSQTEGILADGVILKPIKDRSDFTHVVYRRNKPGTSPNNDTVLPDPVAAATKPPPLPAMSERQASSSQATVEMLILIDSNNALRMNLNYNNINRYVGIFWNSVQSRYASVANPKVKMTLTGVVVFNNSAQEAFVGQSAAPGLDPINVRDHELLTGLKDWLAKYPNLKYDAAMLHTGLEVGKITPDTKEWDTSVTGLAYVGAICQTGGVSSGFSEDILPAFTGVLTAAHELGHILGLPHDGVSPAESCSSDDGNIMSPGNLVHTWQFSSCSLALLQASMTKTKSPCLWNIVSPKTTPLLTDLPSSFAGPLDEQCKLRFRDDTFMFVGQMNADVCNNLWCGDTYTGPRESNGPAIDGTPCGVRQMCTAGSCVASNVARLDDQCKTRYGSASSATNKASPMVCSQLVCKNGGTIKAQEGTFCGNGGMCRSGKCTGQMLSLDEQCKRRFGSAFFADNSRMADGVCTKLWCTEDSQTYSTSGGADALSTCASGKVCSDKACVDLY